MSQILQGIPGVPEKMWNLHVKLSNLPHNPVNSLKATPNKPSEFYSCIKMSCVKRQVS